MSKADETGHGKLRSAAWKAFLLSDLSQFIESRSPDQFEAHSEEGTLAQDVQTVLDSKTTPSQANQLVHSFLVSTVEFYCSAKHQVYSADLRLPQIAYVLRQEGGIHDLEDLQWCFLSFCNRFIPEPDAFSSLASLFRLLIIYHDPVLFSSLEAKRVSIEDLATYWLGTAFAGVCADHVAAAIWSHVFAQPDPFLTLFVAHALLTSVGERLSELTTADVQEFVMAYPQSMQVEDVKDCIMFANYFLNRTPTTFRDVYAHVFHGGTCSPHFGDLSLTALCVQISVRDILAYYRDESVSRRMKYFFVDSRTAEDFERGHLRGSYHVDSQMFLEDPSRLMEELDQALKTFRSACKKGQDHVCLIGYTDDDHVARHVPLAIYPILSQLLKDKIPRVSFLIEGYRGIHDCFMEEPDVLANHNPRFCPYCARLNTQTAKFVSETVEKGARIFDDLKSSVKKTYHKSKKSSLFTFIKSQYSSFSESLSGPADQPICSLEAVRSRPECRFSFDCHELGASGEETNICVILTKSCINFYTLVEGGDCQLHRSKGLTDIVKISTKATDPEQLTFRFGRFDDSELVIDSVFAIKISNPDGLVDSIKQLMQHL